MLHVIHVSSCTSPSLLHEAADSLAEMGWKRIVISVRLAGAKQASAGVVSATPATRTTWINPRGAAVNHRPTGCPSDVDTSLIAVNRN